MAEVKALSFDAALRLLPKLNGEYHESLNTYINTCDFIFANIEESVKPIFLEEAVRYKTINNIDNLKPAFKNTFLKSHLISFLLQQLNLQLQEKGTGVRDYSVKIEHAYHELMEGMTEGRSVVASKQISEVIKVQASSIFIAGIIPIVKYIRKG